MKFPSKIRREAAHQHESRITSHESRSAQVGSKYIPENVSLYPVSKILSHYCEESIIIKKQSENDFFER